MSSQAASRREAVVRREPPTHPALAPRNTVSQFVLVPSDGLRLDCSRADAHAGGGGTATVGIARISPSWGVTASDRGRIPRTSPSWRTGAWSSRGPGLTTHFMSPVVARQGRLSTRSASSSWSCGVAVEAPAAAVGGIAGRFDRGQRGVGLGGIGRTAITGRASELFGRADHAGFNALRVRLQRLGAQPGSSRGQEGGHRVARSLRRIGRVHLGPRVRSVGALRDLGSGRLLRVLVGGRGVRLLGDRRRERAERAGRSVLWILLARGQRRAH